MRTLPWDRLGVEWIQPDLPLAHPLDDGTAVGLHRSLAETADSIGRDGGAWRALLGSLARDWDKLAPALLGPHPFSPHLLALARFGVPGLLPANVLPRLIFREERARALFAGLAAHSFLDFGQPFSSSFGLVLGMLGHAVGWPLPRGGSQSIVDGMARYVRELGGEIVCGWEVASLAELPKSEAVLLDVTPRQFLNMAGRSVARKLWAQIGGIPLWAGGLQDRLCPERSRAVDRARMSPGRDRACGWHLGRSRRVRAGGESGAIERSALRFGGPAKSL